MVKIAYKKGDIVGDYGAIFLEEVEPYISPTRFFRKAKFKCGFCGQEFNAVIAEVKRGKTRSCGCYRKISKAQTHLKDITGEKRGLLTAIKRLDRQASDNSYYWLCQCECGNMTEIPICDFGRIKSCGCLLFHSYGEEWLENILQRYNYSYEPQKVFKDCLGVKGSPLRFDFYLPQENICIEIDGRQHHEPVERFGGVSAWQILQLNDTIKNKYCQQHQIKLIRLDYNGRYFNENQALKRLRQEGLFE